MYKLYLSLLLLFCLPIVVFSQSDSARLTTIASKLETHAAAHPTENIYLQLNKPWYTRADTIWFRLYIVAGSKHQLSALSEVAYAELISPNDTVIQRLNLKLESGMASGDFALPLTLTPGTYRIRACTNWMKNEGEQSFYDRQVVIGNPLSPTLKTKNLTTTTTSTTLTTSPTTDLQFFPEGGTLVNGLRNVVAFKATNPDGTAGMLKGSVVGSDGEAVAYLESGYNGMGVFAFTPEDGKSYVAKVQFGNGLIQIVDLPKTVAEGYTLTVNNQEHDTLLVKIAASPALFKSDAGKGFYLIASGNGKVYYTTSGTLNEAVYSTKIPKDHFPTGILRLTLFSAIGEPLNERVVFIQQPDNLELKIATDKTGYAASDKVILDFSAGTFKGQAAVGSFSAAVINEDKVPVDELAEPTIFSQLLLSSELHGAITNPGYYLSNQDKQTIADLDLLMLTQGYRKLEWKKLLDTAKEVPNYLPETGLTISGTVTTLNGKPILKGKVTLFSAQQLLKMDTLTDNNGRFSFTGLDLDEKAPVIIKAFNGKSNEVNITLDRNEQKITSLPVYPIITGDTSITPLVQAFKKSYAEEEQQYRKAKGKQLKEVVIQDKAIVKYQDISTSANLNGPGHADKIIYGKDLRGFGSLGESLTSKIPFSNYRRPGGHFIIMNKGSSNVVVVVDGAPSSIENVAPDDVYSVEVLTSSNYLAIYGVRGSMLIITTKRGIPDFDQVTEKAPGLIKFNYSGYYKAHTFYTPKYEANNTANQPSAIYWKPDILTDKYGKCSLQYTNAGKGNYRVIIEGIDGEGRLGRAVYRYKVE